MIPTVAEAPRILVVLRRVALEVGAGQVVEEQVVGRAEEILPAAGEAGEEVRPVRQQLVEAAVQRVFGHDPGVFAPKIAHRTVGIPFAVQVPLAPGGEKAVGDQNQQDLRPGGPLAAGREPVAPELVEFERRPELTDDPAGAPLPRALQPELAEAHLHADVDRVRRDRPVGREQGQAELAVRAPFDGLDAPEPAGLLTVVELPEVEHAPIDGPAVGTALLLLDAPVSVLLAVLASQMAAEVHGGPTLTHSRWDDKGVGLPPSGSLGARF